MTTQREKGERFRQLHADSKSFVLPNAWDIVSARMLTALEFPALATSSGAMAATFGRRDGKVTRAEALEHCRTIVSATSLPVAADLEKGYADDPKEVAETIRLAAQVGL